MNALVFNRHIDYKTKQRANFRHTLSLTKRTNGQTDVKHETMGKTLSSMSLSNIVGEKPLPPWRRSRLENCCQPPFVDRGNDFLVKIHFSQAEIDR